MISNLVVVDGNLVQLGGRVKSGQIDALALGKADVAGALARVGKDDVVRLAAAVEGKLDLGSRCAVEARAKLRQQLHNLIGRGGVM